MDIPELPQLKVTSKQSSEIILRLYHTYSLTEIRQTQRYHIQKIDQLKENASPTELIWKHEDRLNLSIYEEERRLYLEFSENDNFNDDNNLEQFDTEFWFNDED